VPSLWKDCANKDCSRVLTPNQMEKNTIKLTQVCQAEGTLGTLGRAYPHRIPLARLKCLSEKRSREPDGSAKAGSRRPGLQSAVSTAYFVLIREMRRLQHRLRLVQSARQQGITPTARLFQLPFPPCASGCGDIRSRGPRGLLELSRDPHHEPGKTPADIEQQVVTLRQKLFTFGARRLIREFDLPLSHRALERIWRQYGLLKKRQRQISAQTRPRPYQGHLARLSADLR